jgi:hypothetical protein
MVAKPSMDYSDALEALGEPPEGPNYVSELHRRDRLADQYKRENMWNSELAFALFLVLLTAIGVLANE